MSGCFVIAEAGVNHNGSLDLALRLVDAAAEAGADAVKFQSFRADRLVTARAHKVAYQREATGSGGSQFEMLRALELDDAAHHRIAERCRMRGIEFMSTPFDHESLALLLGVGVKRLKIPSGEITNGPLLFDAARSGLPVILSTGMSTLGEIEEALAVLAAGYAGETPPPGIALRDALARAGARERLAGLVTILHCTSVYPAPVSLANLRAMDTLARAFGLPVGYSDHTPGIAVSVAAAARGASVIEKHFTLDSGLPGPDHRASLEPAAMRTMIAAIRDAVAALGEAHKGPADPEFEIRTAARKSLVAARRIERGAPLQAADLTAKRPAGGVSPMEYWSLLGRPAARAYDPDDPIER